MNNIVVAAAGQTAVFCADPDLTPPMFKSNDVFAPSGSAYGGICADQTGMNGNISADPLFVNPAAGDYHLQAGSPAIDAGDNSAPSLPTMDLDADARILDGNEDGNAVVDMGADEFAARADLVVTAVSDPPAAVAIGGTFSVTDTVKNQGIAKAGLSSTRYWLSLDTVRSGRDIPLGGARNVPGLLPGSISMGTVVVSVPSNTRPGTYYLLACADDRAEVPESDEKNNCKASAAQVIVLP